MNEHASADERVSEEDVSRCGRPTKSGRPCRARLEGNRPSCALHRREGDEELIKAFQRGLEWERRWSKVAWARGWESGRQALLLDQAKAAREEAQRERWRLTENGHQVVQVDGGYAYRWCGSTPLEIGDEVLLPENYISRMQHGPGPFRAKVIGFGTDYDGSLSSIVTRAGVHA